MTKLITVKGDEQVQFKNLERVEASSHINNDVDASLSPSTITTVTPLSTKDQNKVGLVKKPLKDIVLTGNTTPILKRNHKHKKHHHHRHHHICLHHQNRRNRVKNAGQEQESTIVFHKPFYNEGHTVPTNALTKVRYEIDNETALFDDQQTPLAIDRDVNVRQSMIIDSVSLDEDQNIKSTKGNTPLQPIEKKLVSQREASVDETQVGNFSSIVCNQPATSIINPCGVQQIEQIYYEEDCCLPSSTISCASNPCILQQSNSCVCVCQQQPQILLCTDSCSAQNYICSSNCNPIQQAVVPQQQFICVNNAPTFTNQAPLLCAPQTPIQQTASFVIQQQPQIAQPIQIIQAPQTQSGQYLKISSACPQIIETIPGPNIQNIQPQIIQASPQILYQRPYDPIIIPTQNQQFGYAQIPGIPLSQPSYAPSRPGPRMFQHALVRNIANRTGLPVPISSSGGLQFLQSPTGGPYVRQPLASTARALLTDGSKPSAPRTIIPLTAGGLLIPFQPSEPAQGTVRGTLSRTGGVPTKLKNFNTIRQQIQRRAQVLADIQRQNDRTAPSLPIRSTNAAALPTPFFSRSAPIASPGILPNISRSSSGPTPNALTPFPSLSPGIPQPPPAVIRSQTPYTSKNAFDTSSSSSSRSSASSTLPTSTAQPNATNLIYSQPSFGGSQRGPFLSGPSAPYQSLRP